MFKNSNYIFTFSIFVKIKIKNPKNYYRDINKHGQQGIRKPEDSFT